MSHEGVLAEPLSSAISGSVTCLCCLMYTSLCFLGVGSKVAQVWVEWKTGETFAHNVV